MEKLRKEDIPQEAFDLYDYYCHNKLDRRTFVEKLSAYAVGGITVTALMSSMMPDYVNTRTIEPTDERMQSSDYVMYDSPKGGGQIKGLLSKPAGKGKFPGIVVVHENRGLNPYIEDVGRRCAVDGFISIAPDALTPLGGYPGNDDEGRTMQAKRNRDEMLEDFIAAYEYLKNHPDCNGKVGVVGFCFGGWISNAMAVRIPDGCFIGTLIGVNNWNQSKNSHGTFAYMTQADDKTFIVIESDLMLRGGVEEENLKSWVKNLVNHINPFEELVISTIQEVGEDSELMKGDNGDVWSAFGNLIGGVVGGTMSTIAYLATDSE
jgi:dienelactone hydrolase